MKTVSVSLQRLEDTRIWVAVAFSFRLGYHPNSRFIEYASDFHCDMKPLNEDAAREFDEQAIEDATEDASEGEEYVCSWGGYIAQGVNHGFKDLGKPKKGVLVTRLDGCLGLDGDVEGIIFAARLGVLLLLSDGETKIETPGWKPKNC